MEMIDKMCLLLNINASYATATTLSHLSYFFYLHTNFFIMYSTTYTPLLHTEGEIARMEDGQYNAALLFDHDDLGSAKTKR